MGLEGWRFGCCSLPLCLARRPAAGSEYSQPSAWQLLLLASQLLPPQQPQQVLMCRSHMMESRSSAC